jgi:hypothetical protein
VESAPRILVIDRADRPGPGRVESLLAERGASYAVLFLDQVCAANAPASYHIAPGRAAVMRLRDGRGGETFSTRRLRGVWAEALGLPRNPMTAFLGDEDIGRTLRAVGEGESWLLGLSILACLGRGRLFLPQLVERSRANHRLYQLAVARDSGFSVPRTMVTSHESRVRQDLAPAAGEALHYQSLSQLAFEVRGKAYVSVDRHLEPERLFALRQLRAPAVFSVWPAWRRRLYVAVLGNQMWGLEVGLRRPDLDPEVTDLFYQRAQDNLAADPVELPPALRALCRRFVEASGLRYCTLDLLEENGEADRWCLLAAHPDGRFHLFDEQGLPVYDRLLAALASGALAADRAGGAAA